MRYLLLQKLSRSPVNRSAAPRNHHTRSIMLGALPAVLLAACQAATPQTGEQLALADRLHAAAMRGQPEYVAATNGKAMAACIDWPTATGREPELVWTPWTYVSNFSDGGIPTPTLENDTLLRCRSTAAEQSWHCTCQTIDRNGRNVLRVPQQ